MNDGGLSSLANGRIHSRDWNEGLHVGINMFILTNDVVWSLNGIKVRYIVSYFSIFILIA